MRAIAKFAMRGRSQALMLSIGGISLPGLSWFGAAVVSLVALRRGWREGLMLVLWAALPAAGWLIIVAEPAPLMLLLGAVVLAYVLRLTASWSHVLGITVVLGLPTSWLFELTSAGVIDQVVTFFIEVSEQSGNQPLNLDDRLVLERLLVGLFTAGQLSVMLAAVILARWWQSVLYNPGGFGEEFRGLRLHAGLTLGLILLIVLCYASGNPYLSSWILVLVVPFLVSSIALVHWTVMSKKLGGNWLLVFYLLMLFFMQFILPILVIIAVTDSWVDLRKRIGVNE
ncbi:MAG: hypothetical protein QGD92_06255 [Gammaproteobacteria bacterium]|nr:hypothetical protein [Gammaproteobacteria bacterium]